MATDLQNDGSRTMKLTKVALEKIKPPEKGYDLYWDDEVPGFGVRVMHSGKTTYIINYRSEDRKQRRLSIGNPEILPPVTARKKARQILNGLSGGKDPLADRETAKGNVTFTELAESYIQRHARELKTGAEEERRIRKDLIPAWNNRKATDITRRHILNLVHKIKERGSPIMANRTLSQIKRIFNFGIDNGLVESSPALRIKPVAKENERQRVLSEDEIPVFWRSISEMVWTGPHVKTALQLILTTAQRPGEVIAMEWEEIEGDWWIVPGEKTKNGQPSRVPLSPLALRILSEIPQHGKYVFPKYKGQELIPGSHMATMALSRAVHRNRDKSGLDPWTPHDLRRTAATHIARLGFGAHVGAVLNHTPQGITKRVYDLYTYDKEKRLALNTWGDEITRLITGTSGKVISIG